MRGEGPFLAIEVSSRVGSVAVGGGGSIFASAVLTDASAHASSLVPAIARILSEAGIGRGDLLGILVGRGPGSFTGVRVGAATARGLAVALRIPVWTFSSLAAAAVFHGLPVLRGGTPVAPAEWSGDSRRLRHILFDARQNRLYAACYQVCEDGVEAVVAPHATTIGEVLQSTLPDEVVCAGSGALAHRDRLVAAGFEVLEQPHGTPSAEGLMRLHALDPGVPPESHASRWEPDYLRGSWKTPERGGTQPEARGRVSP